MKIMSVCYNSDINMPYLPSKRFLSTALTIIAMVAIVFAVDYATKQKKGGTLAISPARVELSGVNTDSDGDGLRDWEEKLWGADPQNPDTDGDSTSDGDEVISNRDPLKPGPEDALEEASATKNNVDPQLTKTDIFARDIFASLVSLESSGNVTPDSLYNTSSLLLQGLLQDQPGDKYTINDLAIGGASTAESIRSYGNALGSIIQKHKNLVGYPEVFILNDVLDSEDASLLKKLDPLIAGYKSASTDLLHTTVPQGNVSNHLQALNSLTNIANSLENIKLVLDDPATGMIGIKQYDEELTKLNEAIVKTRGYFIQQRAVFTSQEPGFIFTQ